ncbi:hypothetical protein [Candidatus Frankia nodulisporulans]|uniref:hypothetical protein n=1 Tax=Candidatus Frankia nodulisporulans TaxID=2060052 RepID=UPI0013D4B0E9|nr:hypothetical protein [Candidatus Frankia nodulisporulans]
MQIKAIPGLGEDREPTPRELRRTEAEWPLIEAELRRIVADWPEVAGDLAALDAEIVALSSSSDASSRSGTAETAGWSVSTGLLFGGIPGHGRSAGMRTLAVCGAFDDEFTSPGDGGGRTVR